jgi:uncharacterized membrane protein YeaQ/YmgE (transglycosylase-associated protein family)
MIDILQLLLVGLAVGVVARLVTPGRHSIGVVATSLVGVLGTVGGGLIARQAGLHTTLRWVVAIAVAVVLLLIVSAARGSASRSRRH